jgi:hypothetical protein
MKYPIWALVQVLFIVVEFWLATHSRCRVPVRDAHQSRFEVEEELA